MTAPSARCAPAAVGPVLVRRAVPGDRDALVAMFGRSTALTRYYRFHAPVKSIPERYLADALAGGPLHHALVACPGTGPRLAALASCRVFDEGAAELGLLVEDAWQRRGLGRRLLGELVAQAHRSGLRVLTAQLLTEQAWIVGGLLRRYGACRVRTAGAGVLTVTVRLPRQR